MKKEETAKKTAKKSNKIKKNPKTILKTTKKATTKKKKIEKIKAETKDKKLTQKTVKKEIKKIKAKEKPKKVAKEVEVKKKEVKAKIKEKPKKAITKIEEKPKKVAKKVAAKKEEKLKKVKKVVAKIEKKAKAKVEVKEITEKPEKKVKAIPRRPEKILPSITEEKYPPMPLETLPAEYGENSITLMTVDPNKLFAFWEVRKDTLSIYTGNLNIRLYDVTGIDFDGTNANSYFDIPVNKRIGSWYIDVGPEKEFITDIGIVNPQGIFSTIARSNKVSTPRRTISEEGVLPQKLYETGLYVGY